MGDVIQLLPDHIANQIAAGEVIQRPASVVKELLENAIDAKATKIDVNIKDAGKTLIQIVDNGVGMNQNDAELCFARHATSKVRKADDLFSLTTKGFRGEALASIAAIAHVDLKTKQQESETGHQITIEGSELKNKQEVVAPQGTSFEVKNLFFNVPARRNFLKADHTEFNHIQIEFERIALSHPEIHFTFSHNGSEIYNLHPAVLRKRIVNLLGNQWNDRLVPIEEKTDIVALKGFVIKPEFARKTRGEQYFFVNDRFFKSAYFHNAVSRAYEGLLPDKSFPGYFLYLDVDVSKIDVNVHPTKTEIKFEEEKHIYSIIYSAIKQALGKYNIAPTIEFDQETSFDIPHSMRSQPAKEPSIKVNPQYNPFASTTSKGDSKQNFSKAIVDQGFGKDIAKEEDWKHFYNIEEEKELESNDLDINEEVKSIGPFLVKGNYIISQSKSGLMLIHARRAIERIAYDEISEAFIANPIASQTLLFPYEKEISKMEAGYWESNKALLNQLGFVGDIEEHMLNLTAIPTVLQEEVISKTLDSIFESLSVDQLEKGDIAHWLILSIASAASMKALNLSTDESIQGLIDQLFQCENHSYSPRNNKIIETISMDEIQQKFA